MHDRVNLKRKLQTEKLLKASQEIKTFITTLRNAKHFTLKRAPVEAFSIIR